MVNKNSNIIKQKNKIISNYSPVFFLAYSSIAVFYLFYITKITYSVCFILLLCYLSGFIFSLVLNNFSKQKRKLFKPIIFISLGFVIGAYSFLKLLYLSSPFISLADTKKITTVQFTLTNDPIPAGKHYYTAGAKIISCTYKHHAKFSAKGNIQVFFPAEMIKQNNAFSLNSFKSEKENACKSFFKGTIISADGKFSQKKDSTSKDLFFVAPKLPEFLGWTSFLSCLRAKFRFNLMRLLASWGDAGGLILALLSANKDFLNILCSNAFKNAGLAHILALSGMHLSIISLTSIKFSSIFGKRKIAVWFSLITVIIFVWFAGAAPSLNRALGMMIILTLGKSLWLNPDMLSVLNTMIVLHIIIRPDDAVSLGFMLSYGALAGILILGTAITELLRGKIPPKILEGFSASIGAQLFTAPIVISKLGNIAPIGIIASIIISPIISLFLILGIAGVFFALIFPFTGSIFNFILNILYRFILIITQFFACTPALTIQTSGQKILFSISALCIVIITILISNSIKKKRISALL